MQAPQENWYYLFGFLVRSEITLPEAAPAEPAIRPDIEVRIGQPDATVLEAAKAGAEVKRWGGILPDGTLWMDLPPALYQVQKGAEIRVTPKQDADETDLRAYLLGSAFGFLLHQRGLYPVHGGSVLFGNNAMIITGDMGAGKSTVTSAFVEQGHRFLADDVSAVELSPEGPLVLPAYPQRKLCGDAAAALGYNPDALPLLCEERDKYALRGNGQWCSQPAPLRWIVELTVEEQEALMVEPVPGHEMLKLFLRNLYRSFFYSETGLPPQRMKEVLAIVGKTRFIRISRPAKGQTLDAVVAEIKKFAAEGQDGWLN